VRHAQSRRCLELLPGCGSGPEATAQEGLASAPQRPRLSTTARRVLGTLCANAASPYVVGMEPERLDPKRRALEKQRSRKEDARALASGEKTLEQLERENGHFVFPHVRISFKGSRPLE
jgi:hypothetical protein